MTYLIWYKTGYVYGHYPIEEVEISRFSQRNVWVRMHALFEDQEDMERKEQRHSNHADYWPDYAAASAHMLKRATEELHAAEKVAAKAYAAIHGITSGSPSVRKVSTQVKLPAGTEIIL